MGEHNHDECGCGCGCGPDEENEFITLTLDDGKEINCIVLKVFTVDEKDYIALLPEEGMEEEDSELFIYRFLQDKDGEPELINIEDDEEFEAVADALDELLDSDEFDEMFDEDEEEPEEEE